MVFHICDPDLVKTDWTQHINNNIIRILNDDYNRKYSNYKDVYTGFISKIFANADPNMKTLYMNTVNILSINSILVKCSIIEGSYLDSSKEPIIYSFFPNVLPGEKIIERPKNLIYLPLIVPTIYNIGIELIDNNGKLLNLRGETVTIRLHLREA